MSPYKYRVVPAPTKGLKAKGIKTHEARFSFAIEDLMNRMAAEGWEYLRAETLPSIERSGLTSSKTEWRNVLVFRKPSAAQVAPAPAIVPVKQAAPEVDREPVSTAEIEDDPHPAGGTEATQMLADNGVEETSEVSGTSASP